MRKLRLDIDALRVESFSIPTRPPVGTVNARNFDPLYQEAPPETFEVCYGGGANTVGTCVGPTYCCPATWRETCNTCGTCRQSCYGTCDRTCAEGVSCTDVCTNCSI